MRACATKETASIRRVVSVVNVHVATSSAVTARNASTSAKNSVLILSDVELVLIPDQLPWQKLNAVAPWEALGATVAKNVQPKELVNHIKSIIDFKSIGRFEYFTWFSISKYFQLNSRNSVQVEPVAVQREKILTSVMLCLEFAKVVNASTPTVLSVANVQWASSWIVAVVNASVRNNWFNFIIPKKISLK